MIHLKSRPGYWALLAACLSIARADLAPGASLEIDARISLGSIRGRIDHLAIDTERKRLYVAELGNDSVGVVDLNAGEVLRTITGLHEPQGIAYEPRSDTVYVASGGDGTLRLYRGSDLTEIKSIKLGRDADNVRVEDGGRRVFVGYGEGALAAINIQTQQKISNIALPAHPESFGLEATGRRIFVNVPNAHAIVVVDRDSRKQVSTWPTGSLRANFPLALDEAGRVITVFRTPARMAAFEPGSGRMLQSVETCGDADDVFVDGRRHAIYVICGAGFVDVFSGHGDAYSSPERVTTASGARTGLYSLETDRLYIAVPARGKQTAAIWVLRPN